MLAAGGQFTVGVGGRLSYETYGQAAASFLPCCPSGYRVGQDVTVSGCNPPAALS